MDKLKVMVFPPNMDGKEVSKYDIPIETLDYLNDQSLEGLIQLYSDIAGDKIYVSNSLSENGKKFIKSHLKLGEIVYVGDSEYDDKSVTHWLFGVPITIGEHWVVWDGISDKATVYREVFK